MSNPSSNNNKKTKRRQPGVFDKLNAWRKRKLGESSSSTDQATMQEEENKVGQQQEEGTHTVVARPQPQSVDETTTGTGTYNNHKEKTGSDPQSFRACGNETDDKKKQEKVAAAACDDVVEQETKQYNLVKSKNNAESAKRKRRRLNSSSSTGSSNRQDHDAVVKEEPRVPSESFKGGGGRAAAAGSRTARDTKLTEHRQVQSKDVDAAHPSQKSRRRIQALQQQLESEQQQRAQLEQRLRKSRMQEQTDNATICELNCEKEELQKRCKSLQQDKKSTRQKEQELDQMSTQIKSLQQQNQVLQQENQTLRQKEEEWRRHNGSLQQDYQSLQQRHEELRKRNESLQQDNESLRQKAEEQRKYNESLQQDNKSLRQRKEEWETLFSPFLAGGAKLMSKDLGSSSHDNDNHPMLSLVPAATGIAAAAAATAATANATASNNKNEQQDNDKTEPYCETMVEANESNGQSTHAPFQLPPRGKNLRASPSNNRNDDDDDDDHDGMGHENDSSSDKDVKSDHQDENRNFATLDNTSHTDTHDLSSVNLGTDLINHDNDNTANNFRSNGMTTTTTSNSGNEARSLDKKDSDMDERHKTFCEEDEFEKVKSKLDTPPSSSCRPGRPSSVEENTPMDTTGAGTSDKGYAERKRLDTPENPEEDSSQQILDSEKNAVHHHARTTSLDNGTGSVSALVATHGPLKQQHIKHDDDVNNMADTDYEIDGNSVATVSATSEPPRDALTDLDFQEQSRASAINDVEMQDASADGSIQETDPNHNNNDKRGESGSSNLVQDEEEEESTELHQVSHLMHTDSSTARPSPRGSKNSATPPKNGKDDDALWREEEDSSSASARKSRQCTLASFIKPPSPRPKDDEESKWLKTRKLRPSKTETKTQSRIGSFFEKKESKPSSGHSRSSRGRQNHSSESSIFNTRQRSASRPVAASEKKKETKRFRKKSICSEIESESSSDDKSTTFEFHSSEGEFNNSPKPRRSRRIGEDLKPDLALSKYNSPTPVLSKVIQSANIGSNELISQVNIRAKVNRVSLSSKKAERPSMPRLSSESNGSFKATVSEPPSTEALRIRQIERALEGNSTLKQHPLSHENLDEESHLSETQCKLLLSVAVDSPKINSTLGFNEIIVDHDNDQNHSQLGSPNMEGNSKYAPEDDVAIGPDVTHFDADQLEKPGSFVGGGTKQNGEGNGMQLSRASEAKLEKPASQPKNDTVNLHSSQASETQLEKPESSLLINDTETATAILPTGETQGSETQWEPLDTPLRCPQTENATATLTAGETERQREEKPETSLRCAQTEITTDKMPNGETQASETQWEEKLETPLKGSTQIDSMDTQGSETQLDEPEFRKIFNKQPAMESTTGNIAAKSTDTRCDDTQLSYPRAPEAARQSQVRFTLVEEAQNEGSVPARSNANKTKLMAPRSDKSKSDPAQQSLAPAEKPRIAALPKPKKGKTQSSLYSDNDKWLTNKKSRRFMAEIEEDEDDFLDDVCLPANNNNQQVVFAASGKVNLNRDIINFQPPMRSTRKNNERNVPPAGDKENNHDAEVDDDDDSQEKNPKRNPANREFPYVERIRGKEKLLKDCRSCPQCRAWYVALEGQGIEMDDPVFRKEVAVQHSRHTIYTKDADRSQPNTPNNFW